MQKSGCTWWCYGRWYADRISLHPVFGAAARGLEATKYMFEFDGPHLRHAINVQAATLDLQVDVTGGAYRFRPDAHCDDRVKQVFSTLTHGSASGASKRGCHALRIAARAKVLQLCRATRYDAAGVDRVDIEAQSNAKWRSFIKGLSCKDQHLLRVVRGGAIRSPTRAYRGVKQVAGPETMVCVYCQCFSPSARHLFESCPGPCSRFAHCRASLSAEYELSNEWWLQQPAVTTKSCWITLDANPDANRR
eukprot:1052506-Karenia_brevis.AAC.1